MAKGSQKLDNLFIPKTRKDTFNKVRSAVEDKYGWELGNFGFSEFNYKTYKNRYRKLSSEQTKAAGKNVYIDTRTGQVWDPAYGNQLKSSINADKKVLVNSSKSMMYGDLGQGIQSNLQKIKIFQAQNRKSDAKQGYGSELGTLNKIMSPTTVEGGKEIDIRRENELNRLDTNIANEKAKLRDINTYTPNANQLRLIEGEGQTNWQRNNEAGGLVDGVNQPGYRPSTGGNVGRLTIDVNGEVSDQVQKVVNEYIDPLSNEFGNKYKAEEVNNNKSNASEAAIKTNNTNDQKALSTIEENLSSDGIPLKKHWIESVRDVEDGVTDYKNSEEYRRLLMAKEFASRKLKIKKPDDEKSKTVILPNKYT